MLQENGPSEEEVAKIKKVEQRKWESALQENLFWHELTVNILQHRVYFQVRHVACPGMHGAAASCQVLRRLPVSRWLWSDEGHWLPLVSVRPQEQDKACSQFSYFLDTK